MAAVVAALVAPACSSGGASATKTLPDATLVSLADGSPATWPTDGKPLVVNFWASWCTPCRKEMPAFDRVHQHLGDQVDIVGITDEANLDAARKAAKQAGVTYPLLVDQDQTLLTDLTITGLPGTIFVDADGTVVDRHLGALTEDELTKAIDAHFGISS